MNEIIEGSSIINQNNEVSHIFKIVEKSDKLVYFDQNDKLISVDLGSIELATSKYESLLKEAKERALGSVYVSYFDGVNWSNKDCLLYSILPLGIENRFVIIKENMYGKEYMCVSQVRVNSKELLDLENELGI